MKMKKSKKIILLAASIYATVSGNYFVVQADIFSEYAKEQQALFREDLPLYQEYLKNVDLRDIVTMPLPGYEEQVVSVYKIEVMDVNDDRHPDLVLHGPGASCAEVLGILSVIDGQVECVYNYWGTILGQYPGDGDAAAGTVIRSGNGDTEESAFDILLFHPDWETDIIGWSNKSTYEDYCYYEIHGQEVSEHAWYSYENFIWENCAALQPVYIRDGVTILDGQALSEQLMVMVDTGAVNAVEPVIFPPVVYDASAGIFEMDSYESSTNSEFIIPDSAMRYLQESDLARLSSAELRLARNEIYARHGRMFNAEDLQAYFNGKSWYQGIYGPDEFPEDILNDVEQENITFIHKYEQRVNG